MLFRSNLKLLIEKKTNLVQILHQIYNKKIDIREKRQQLQLMLENTISKEKNIFTEHNIINKQTKQIAVQKSEEFQYLLQRKKELTISMEELQQIKQEIMDNINLLIRSEDNLSLSIDQILFDNTVMLDTIFDNLSELEKLL